MQNETSNRECIVEYALDLGMDICLNPSPFPSIEEYANLTFHDFLSIIAVNQKEFKLLLSCMGGIYDEAHLQRSLEFIASELPKLRIILLTLGSEGSCALYRKDDETFLYSYLKALPLENALDTTGSGDTFLGYFLTRLFQESSISTINSTDLLEALRFGSRAAAASCNCVGSFRCVPDLKSL